MKPIPRAARQRNRQPGRLAAGRLVQVRTVPGGIAMTETGDAQQLDLRAEIRCANRQAAQRHRPWGLDGERIVLPAFGKQPALVKLLGARVVLATYTLNLIRAAPL
jgi:hypothetical protein